MITSPESLTALALVCGACVSGAILGALVWVIWFRPLYRRDR